MGDVGVLSDYSYTEKGKKQGATFEKKSGNQTVPDDNNNNNNNNNNNRCEVTVHSHFTPQFIVYKANTMNDKHIRPTMNYEL